MRSISVDLLKCKLNKVTPDSYVLLYLLYHKNFKEIEKIFGRQNAIELRNNLCSTKYILSDVNVPFKKTTLSKKNVCVLFGIREDSINFMEWYNCYPLKHGNRVFRAKDPDSKLAQKHKAKYLNAIKTEEEHQLAIKATEAYVKRMRNSGKLPYLPNMETVINNRYWEQWEEFIVDEVVKQSWTSDLV